jgi:hypothetical protein
MFEVPPIGPTNTLSKLHYSNPTPSKTQFALLMALLSLKISSLPHLILTTYAFQK